MAVTADQLINSDGRSGRVGGPVAASTTLYGGTIAFFNATGYIDDDTASGVNVLAGIVVRQVDNSSGSAGDLNAEVLNSGKFVLVGSGFTQGDVGSLIYASDNYTITTTSTSNTLIGRCVEFISATQLKVELEPAVDQ